MINYQYLHDSTVFYEIRGFKRIEAPWLVSKSILDITRPETAEDYSVSYAKKRKSFVASGEQSFLYLINKGYLPKGKYQTITPCMRYEDFDDYHTKYFIKNELIDTENISDVALQEMIETARQFFISVVEKTSSTHFDSYRISKIQTGEHSFDLNFDEIEIGSYGIRHCNFISWVYGTGLAEPRFSRLLERRI